MSLFPELEKPSPDKAEKPSPAPPPGRKRKSPAPAPESYLALARKYRPGTFEEVVGQNAVIETLINAIEQKRLHHAYLFSGIRGVGKTTVARLFARALNCDKGPTAKPCGKCDPCVEISSGMSLDVIELDAASNRGVDDVEPLREAARYAPSRDRNKVFILDEAHMLSNAAFNSLLKILEEPPPRIVWILATTEYRKVPPTVVSRCQHFEFHRVSRDVVSEYLGRIARAEKVDVEPEGLEIIAATAGGSVRDAVSLLDQAIAYAGRRADAEDVRNAIGVIDRRLMTGFLKLVSDKDAPGLLERIASLAEAGTDYHQFAVGLVQTVRDATVLRFAPEGSRAVAVTEDEARELRELAGGFSEDGLLRLLNSILDLPAQLRGAPQPRFVLEAAALRMTRLADLTPIEEVIREMRGEAASPPAAGGPGASGGGGPAGPEGGGSFSSKLGFNTRKGSSMQPREASSRPAASPPHAGQESFSSRMGLEQGKAKAGAPGEERPSSRSLPPESNKSRRERLIQEAMSNPGVKLVLDTFSGQIVDIRDLT